ncbi:MAG TPA: hypothetical protein VKF36_25265 [Syntrophorhabdales bacterium]|nr:hypothetical protein [Syntrophorhabdales bacterium]
MKGLLKEIPLAEYILPGMGKVGCAVFFETSRYCYFLNLLVSLTNLARTVSGPNPHPT